MQAKNFFKKIIIIKLPAWLWNRSIFRNNCAVHICRNFYKRHSKKKNHRDREKGEKKDNTNEKEKGRDRKRKIDKLKEKGRYREKKD